MMLKWLWLSGVIVIVDQITKVMVSRVLPLHEPLVIMPSLNITLTYNTGAAFSFLSDASGWQRWVFTGLALLVSGALIFWLRRLPRHKVTLAAALALIVGGALGNAWDRIRLGYVIDFIDVYYDRWHWPAFNVADSAITVAALLLVIDAFSGNEGGWPARKRDPRR